MSDSSSSDIADDVRRLEKAFESIGREAPFLKPVANAFKGLFISRAILKAKLSERNDPKAERPDPRRLLEGQPLLSKRTVVSLMDPWGKSVESAMPPLAEAFPAIQTEVMRLREALERNEVDLEQCMFALVDESDEDLSKIALRLDVQPVVLEFILGQMLKPFVEKRTEGLRSLISGFSWFKGYCPMCGSFPELSFLQGDEGHRWLRCSLCGYHWRFDRMVCPYCEGRNEKKELVSVEGSEHRWAELCSNCRRYVVGTDLRKRTAVPVEVAAVGMVHLDIIAQQKGFSPMATCAWNGVIPENRS